MDAMNQSISRDSARIMPYLLYVELAQKEKLRDAMNKRIHELVSLYQEHLGLYVDPIDAELTAFTFINIDPDAWSRRFTFTVNVARNCYEVDRVEPAISGGVDELVTKLNASQDFFAFLRAMRRAFKATCSK